MPDRKVVIVASTRPKIVPKKESKDPFLAVKLAYAKLLRKFQGNEGK